MRQLAVGGGPSSTDSSRSNEQGWALLGLLLALGVMSIVLASSIVPNVQMQVQRDKEIEMMYRGEQAAEGIARYYNGGRLGPIQLFQRPPYGYLTELAKLRDGVTIGVRDIKFVRASAMIDPMTNDEWEPVRLRDPRIAKFLQAWAAQTLTPIPSQYLLLAAPPTKSVFGKPNPASPEPPPGGGSSGPPPGGGSSGPPPGGGSSGPPPGGGSSGPPPLINPANPGNPQIRPPGQTKPDSDDDDDDDDELNDPLAHLFPKDAPGQSNVPIIGVVPKRKGKAANAYFGLANYEEWVFLYIPKNLPLNLQQNPGGQQRQPNQNQNRPPQVSQ